MPRKLHRFSALLLLAVTTPALAEPSREELLAKAKAFATTGRTYDGRHAFDAAEMREWSELARTLADAHGRVTPLLQEVLYAVEKDHGASFTGGARAAFQTFVGLVGGKMNGAIDIPADRTPYWLKDAQPLADFRSTPELPEKADIVIVGTGLTGSSAAYHLAEEAKKRGLTVVVLEANDPGTGASGRNGGNFELIPENFAGGYGEYDGLEEERYKFWRKTHPDMPEAELRAEARRQAETIMKFGLRNARRMLDIVDKEKLAVDLSAAGWLRIAYSAREEDAIRKEVELGKANGLDFEILTPAAIKERYGLETKFIGRLAKENGNYHPFKFVTGILEKAIERGVKLYTRTPVLAVEEGQGERLVKTSRGTIRAKTVIAATNAFTSKIFPELRDIEYYQSQIFNLEHVLNKLRGITFTDKDGDVYSNFPRGGTYVDENGERRGTMHVGGGKDRPGVDPAKLRRSRSVFEMVLEEVRARFDGVAKQPPSRMWTGPMAFTPDRLPALGFLREGIIVAAGFNGYGGTYCVEAGALTAEMALTGATPANAPETMFSPKRLVRPVERTAVAPDGGRAFARERASNRGLNDILGERVKGEVDRTKSGGTRR